MKFQVHYMRPEHFGIGIMGEARPNPKELDRTHIHLGEFEASSYELLYYQMQGEIWSPNGEATDLIIAKGLRHTSMSVGDVAVDESGFAWLVQNVGWFCLGRTTEDAR